MAELIETLVLLKSLEANIVPVVFEAPERCVIDKRLEGRKKGFKAEDVHKAANTVYGHAEFLLSV